MPRSQYLFILSLIILTFLTSCELTPSRPEDVFTVYRERMRSGNLLEARKLLSTESRSLAEALETKYKLETPPEDLAILNIVDPQSTPAVTLTEDKFALVNVRTIRGVPKMVRLVRENARSHWKINLNEELTSLEAFLEAQVALEIMREKAGDYAASWKAFNEQIERMNVPDEAPRDSSDKTGKSSPKKQGLRKNVR